MAEQGLSAGRRSCAIVGITYRQLDYWARTDLIRPVAGRRQGQRHPAALLLPRPARAEDDQEPARRRHQARVGPRRRSTYLRDHLGDDLAAANLVIAGDRVGPRPRRRASSSTCVEARARACSTSCPSAACKDEVDAAIVELRPATAARPRGRHAATRSLTPAPAARRLRLPIAAAHLAARRRPPRPRGQDGRRSAAGTCRCRTRRHARRAPGLPHRRGGVRRQPPRHGAGATGADALDRLQAALTNDLGKIAPGRAQYTHLLDEADALGARRHHRVVGRRRARSTSCPTPPTPSRVRGAPSGGDDVTDDAGHHRRAGARGPAPAGRRGARGGRGRPRSAWPTSTWHGVAVHRGRHGLHGRGRRRAGRARADAAAELWEALLAAGVAPGRPRRPRHAAARGRPAPARPRARARASPRCRPAWAGWWPGTRATSGAARRSRPSGTGAWPAGCGASRSRAAARPGRASRCWSSGEPVGEVTSGNFSPTLGRGIALAFLATARAWRSETRWTVDLRGTAAARPSRQAPRSSPRGQDSGRSVRWATSSPTPTAEIAEMLGLPRPVVARRAVRRRPRRAAAGRRRSTCPDGLSEPDVAAGSTAWPGPTGRRARPGVLRRGRGLRPRHPGRGAPRWPSAPSSSPPTRPTSPRWPRASSRRCSSTRRWSAG